MNVMFHDIQTIMPLGSAKSARSLGDLLEHSDFASLHVPESDETRNLIGRQEILLMKRGSFLLNASRGSVVDIQALRDALKVGHLEGAAIDVFPEEPEVNGFFNHIFDDCNNVILTPHIGGSTEEAQTAIGGEVSDRLVKFIEQGSTVGSVNLPELDLRLTEWKGTGCRILNVHHNVPGVLKVT